MTTVRYYHTDDPRHDPGFVSVMSTSISQLVEGLLNGSYSSISNAVRITLKSSIPAQVVTEVFDIYINEDRSRVTVGGVGVDLVAGVGLGLASDVIAAAIVANIGGGVLLGIGISAAAAGGIAYAYSSLLEPYVDSHFDELAGTVDKELQLVSESGTVYGGAFYKDGFGSISEREAIAELLKQSINGDLPSFQSGHKITVLTGQTSSQTAEYQVYDAEVLERVNSQFHGNDSAMSTLLGLSKYNPADGRNVSNSEMFVSHGGEDWIFAKETDLLAVKVNGPTKPVVGFAFKDIFWTGDGEEFVDGNSSNNFFTVTVT